MAVVDLDRFYFGGRLIGCYTYMMLCADSDDIHIKIGISQDPHKRALELYSNSPLQIEWMALVGLQSRQRARMLERALHDAFAKWRTNGEWFKFSSSDKEQFNVIQRSVLAEFESPSRKLRWGKVNVKELHRRAKQRLASAQRRWKTGGLAFRDAVSAGLRNGH